MVVAGWIYLPFALLSLAIAVAHSHSEETETYHVSIGHLFVLSCNPLDASTKVTWSRWGRDNLSLPAGVEVREGLLWFIPVQMSHNGSYTCEKRNGTGLSWMKFFVSVSSEQCPDAPETISISQRVNGGLPCQQKEIFGLNKTHTIRWMKDCNPMEREGEPIFVDEDGFVRLPALTEMDAGKYTCLVDISLDGKNYTSARSIQLSINDVTDVFVDIELVRPRQEVVMVEVGQRVELQCLAYIGFSEDSEISVYWTIGSDFVEEHKELVESKRYIHNSGKVFIESTLSISEVLPKFLRVRFQCKVQSPSDQKFGYVWLQEVDHSAFHTSVALCLAASVAVLALAAAFFLFKVDLALAYRKLLQHFSKQQTPDGKIYDAYVSFLHSDTLSSAEAESFALQILPEQLEKQHGYSLYIRGRDDSPGEAVHDIISATLRQSRRLIIILSTEAISATHGETEEEPLYDNQVKFCYEQKIGLYDALTLNNLQVILVEIDGPVDYSCLPESLRYIKRKQGSLKWKKPSSGTHKLNKMCSNRNFWKNLRYRMPSVPAGRLQTIV